MKPTHLLIVLLTFFQFQSCTSTFLKPQRPCYKELKKFADDHWQYSNNDSLIKWSQYLDSAAFGTDPVMYCTQGLSKNQIIKLFGEPHYIDQNSSGTLFYYFTTKVCYPFKSTNYCSFYVFKFYKFSESCKSFSAGGLSRES